MILSLLIALDLIIVLAITWASGELRRSLEILKGNLGLSERLIMWFADVEDQRRDITKEEKVLLDLVHAHQDEQEKRADELAWFTTKEGWQKKLCKK
jgi:hypothetical protein